MNDPKYSIREIRRICDEALDHDTGWYLFRALVEKRLELETAFLEFTQNPPTQ